MDNAEDQGLVPVPYTDSDVSDAGCLNDSKPALGPQEGWMILSPAIRLVEPTAVNPAAV